MAAAAPEVGRCYERPIATVIMGAVSVDCAGPHRSGIAAAGSNGVNIPKSS